MKIEKTLLILSFGLLSLAMAGQDAAETKPAGPPQTSFTFEVEAVVEHFHAGPYAQFAQKYLGVEVRQEDESSCTISRINLTPNVLVGEYLPAAAEWRYPLALDGNFTDDGLTSNVASESTTLYKTVKQDDAYTKVAVQQSVMVAKTLEKKAAETASLIFELRRKRFQIVTGDTDATYSGEAMGAAIVEISRMEKEYMTMFVGYSSKTVQQITIDYFPDKAKQRDIVFRVSDSEGLTLADNLAGKPVVIEINPLQEVEQEVVIDKKAKKAPKGMEYVTQYYPADCTVKLINGKETLLSKRLPVYQFGGEVQVLKPQVTVE